MLLNNDIHQLFRSRTNHRSFLLNYASIANTLMYQEEDFIREVTAHLITEIIKHSKSSSIYRRHSGVITKSELLDKDRWYIKDYDSFENETSGSTGQPFRYKIWKDIYRHIECENHYKTITDEFNIHGPTKILYLHGDIVSPNTTQLVKIYVTQNPLVSHGLSGQAEIHAAILNHTFFNNYYRYYEELLEYATKNKIDIIHAQSNMIASLAWNAKRLKWNGKICRLLSNTGSKLDKSCVIELEKNGNIDAWCDHMRCWDGGVTFFTCRYNIYHLLDSLAWAYTDNYRLVSYDYFSLPSPFVNYWNGDYASISDNYERCKCGRAYRPFTMGRTRSTISQISEISSIQNAIVANGLLDGLKRIEVVRKFMRIFTKYLLPHSQRQLIRNIFPNTDLQFTVEEEI